MTEFIAGKVRLIEERYQEVWVSGVGKEAMTRQESLGWHVVLDTGAGFGFGKSRPDCEVGDEVFVEFRRSKQEREKHDNVQPRHRDSGGSASEDVSRAGQVEPAG